MSATMMAAMLFLIFGLASTVQAQPMPSHFAYADNKRNKLDLYLRREYSFVHVEARTCLGDVGGPVTPASNKSGGDRTLLLKVKNSNREGTCVLRIKFNKNYTRATIKETNCLDHHGVACGFNGHVRRRLANQGSRQ